MNYYLIYVPEDEDTVQEKLIPLFPPGRVSAMEWPESGDLRYIKEDGRTCVLYLPEKELRVILTEAADKECLLAILPHPGAKTMTGDLGIEQDSETIIQSLGSIGSPSHLELLYCNNEPVFYSLKAGPIFEWEYGVHSLSIWKKALHFFRSMRAATRLIYQPYSVSIGEEKIIETAATGILAVERASNSIISRQWATEPGIADGSFHFFIVSPQNFVDLISYVFRSLFSDLGKKAFKPDFIGYIKTPNITLTGSGQIRYLIDDQERSAESLELEVHSNSLNLLQESTYAVQELKEAGKKSIQVKGLPAGERKQTLLGRKVPWLPRATSEEFEDLFTTLRANAQFTTPFMVMMVLATLIATFGLYADSSPVIIGAMILAPLMAPIVSFSMGLIRYDLTLMANSIKTVILGSLTGLFVGISVTYIIPMEIITDEIQARLSPNLLDLGIAVASGIAAAYAHAREDIAQSLAGVAIAVALVPPLAVTGIGIGWMEWHIFSGSLLLFLTNLAGIILFAGITFYLLGYAPFKRAGKGLLYTLFIVLALCIPLSFAFTSIIEEARITSELEGYSFNGVTIKDVDVIQDDELMITIRLVSPRALGETEISEVKSHLSEKLGRKVRIQMISVIELH